MPLVYSYKGVVPKDGNLIFGSALETDPYTGRTKYVTRNFLIEDIAAYTINIASQDYSNNFVHKLGQETISGQKTFNYVPFVTGFRTSIATFNLPNDVSPNSSPDALAININGQSPMSIPGFIGGVVVNAAGLDNVSFYTGMNTTAGDSTGMLFRSYDLHTGNFIKLEKIISSVTTTKFLIDNFGNTTANSFIKTGGTSSQFLKADGSIDSTTYQPLLTNPIIGSLNPNYIPKATGTNTLGNSLIYDNGTYIGINNNNPLASVDIITPAITGRESIIKARVSDNSLDVFGLSNGTTVANRFVPTFFGFSDGSYGSLAFRGLSTSAYDLSSSSPYVSFLAANTNSTSDPNNGVLTAPINRPAFSWATVGTEYMRIIGGNLLINTTFNNAVDKLQVNGSFIADSLKKLGGTSTQFLKADGSVDSTTYQPLLTNPITGSLNPNYIPKATGANTLGDSTIFDNGTNVGIGTTSPTAKLELGGQTGQTASPISFRFSNDYSNGATADKSKLFLYNAGGTEIYGIGIGPLADMQYHSGGASNTYSKHNFYTANNLRMTILNSGNVGIGTTSPGEKLDVDGNGKFNGKVIAGAIKGFRNSDYVQNSPNPIWSFLSSEGYGMAYYQGTALPYGDAIGFHFGNIATPAFYVDSNGRATGGNAVYASNFVTLQQLDTKANLNGGNNFIGNQIIDGNVGIGTTSPNRLLTVEGTTSGIIALNASSYRNTTIGSDSVGNFVVYDDTAASYRMVINSSGNVGIGTTTVVASAKVQIDSTTQGFLPPRMTNAQRIAIASPAIGLMVYCTDAVEGVYVNKSTGWTFIG